jgi:hypothetical protein
MDMVALGSDRQAGGRLGCEVQATSKSSRDGGYGSQWRDRFGSCSTFCL